MGRLMARIVPDLNISLIGPVSLHSARRRERGYDQSAVLSREVARVLQLPWDRAAIQRVRPTQQQATLDAAARQKNLAGAFVATSAVQGKRVLLIDDVTTTGATLESAAESAHRAGAEAVLGLVFAWAE